MMKTQVNKSLASILSHGVSIWSGPELVKTISRPMIPKAIEVYMKIWVEIFCIDLLNFYLNANDRSMIVKALRTTNTNAICHFSGRGFIKI